MEVPRFAAVGLSLMLAANCFMPCYTLAYADEPQGVPDVFEEEQKEVSDDANRRLVQANQSLMAQMETQQQRDTEETLKRQKAQGRILRQIMGD